MSNPLIPALARYIGVDYSRIAGVEEWILAT